MPKLELVVSAAEPVHANLRPTMHAAGRQNSFKSQWPLTSVKHRVGEEVQDAARVDVVRVPECKIEVPIVTPACSPRVLKDPMTAGIAHHQHRVRRALGV